LKKYIFILLTLFLSLGADNKIDLWGIDLDSTPKDSSTNSGIVEENSIKKDKDREEVENIQIEYEKDYDIAQKRAIDEDKYIFLLVTEKNCPWCVKLKEKVLVNPEVAKRLKSDFIPIEVDKEEGYYPTLPIMGTPSIFILNPEDNKTLESVSGYRDSIYMLNLFNRVRK